MHGHVAPQTISTLITVAIVGLVLAFRLRNLRRATPLRLETLWIVPALYLAMATALYWQFPPRGAQWLYVAAALALGAAIGWRRGKAMRIGVDPVTHALNQQASPAAVLVLVALIAVRAGLRYEARSLGIDVMALTDVLVAFALGLFGATRSEMFLRARRLLAAARAG